MPSAEGTELTEAEWLGCTEPRLLLEELRSRTKNTRKLRLLACASCRRVWHLLSDVGRRAVEVAERFADGHASVEELRAYRGAYRAYLLRADNAAYFAAAPSADYYGCARYALAHAMGAAGGVTADREAKRTAEKVSQAKLARDIFGNPFHSPSPLSLSVLRWDDQLVIRLARTIYVERRWGDLPLLADALLDAGCDDEALLAHCRGESGHAQGCWAVDLILNYG